MSAGWTEGLKSWLARAETDAETIEVNGVTHRYKLVSEKEFLTPGCTMKLVRRVYQPDAGGKCYVPLDAAWGMEGQFATIEVRCAALYAVALGTPREAETQLGKCALFRPSATAIKRMANQMGQWLEEHEENVLTAIREEEAIPAETGVLCASLDGVNVLLSEPGKKTGRPNERPHEDGSRETLSPTCYKNAMVGSVSFYGLLRRGGGGPRWSTVATAWGRRARPLTRDGASDAPRRLAAGRKLREKSKPDVRNVDGKPLPLHPHVFAWEWLFFNWFHFDGNAILHAISSQLPRKDLHPLVLAGA